jgi:hypothetical protein
MEGDGMALSLAIRFQAKLRDALNVEGLATAYAQIDPTTTFSDIIGQFASWLADLDALTDGQITGTWISALPALPDGLKTAPVDTSRVEQVGILNFTATGTSRRWGEAIPALSVGSTVQVGGKIVLAGGNPAAILAGLMTTPTSTLAYSNEGGQLLASLRDALISFRSYRGQLASATYERAQ